MKSAKQIKGSLQQKNRPQTKEVGKAKDPVGKKDKMRGPTNSGYAERQPKK